MLMRRVVVPAHLGFPSRKCNMKTLRISNKIIKLSTTEVSLM